MPTAPTPTPTPSPTPPLVQNQILPIGMFSAGLDCADGSKSQAIQISSQTDVRMIKSACLPLNPTVALNPGALTLANNGTAVTYNGLTYYVFVANQITFVQEAEVKTTNNASVTFQKAATSGDLNVCAILYQPANATTTLTVTDSAGNLYQRAVTPVKNIAGGNLVGELWYSQNANGSARTTISSNFNTTTGLTIMVCAEYSGIAAMNALDATSVTSDSSTGDINVTSITASSPNEVIFSAVWSGTALAGFGMNTVSGISGDVYMDKIVTSPGPVQVTANVDNNWTGITVSFRSK